MLTPYRESTALTPLLPRAFAERLRQELEPDERLLWVGRPTPRRLWMPSLLLVPFAMLWNAFVVNWMLGAAHGHLLYAIFGGPFAFVGLYLLYTPYRSWRSALETFYAVTTRRAVIVSGDTTRSVTRRMITELIRTERRDGSGDLMFGTDNRATSGTLGFIGVANPREAERVIREQMT